MGMLCAVYVLTVYDALSAFYHILFVDRTQYRNSLEMFFMFFENMKNTVVRFSIMREKKSSSRYCWAPRMRLLSDMCSF